MGLTLYLVQLLLSEVVEQETVLTMRALAVVVVAGQVVLPVLLERQGKVVLVEEVRVLVTLAVAVVVKVV
jgi:hypothetical protein